jgi:hypothetical protein
MPRVNSKVKSPTRQLLQDRGSSCGDHAWQANGYPIE